MKTLIGTTFSQPAADAPVGFLSAAEHISALRSSEHRRGRGSAFRGLLPSIPGIPALLVTLVFTAITCAPALAATIPNPSFESNSAFTVSPGTVALNAPITGWTANDTTRVGLNPANAQNFHADNGIVPNGTRVAFLNSVSGSPAAISTTITGLTVGRHYRVQFRYNRKAGPIDNTPVALCRLNGSLATGFDTFFAVNNAGEGTVPYRTMNVLFIASATTATFEVSNTTIEDSTLLVDNFTITLATTLQVTNVNNDGPGSLRQTLAKAATTTAFEVITFAPALSGQRIVLQDQLVLADPTGVAIDASALPKGITLAPRSGAGFGIMQALSEALHVRAVHFAEGRGVNGGALNADLGANVTLVRCSLLGNGSPSTTFGGAIFVNATVMLSQCTLSQNLSSTTGGAIHVQPDVANRLWVDQSTISGNSATTNGGGIHNEGALTIINSIIADNSSGGGQDINNTSATGSLTRVGANIVPSSITNPPATETGDDAILLSPLLGLPADNGGPTPTMALGPTSPARNASLGSVYTTDQRGRSKQGTADIGAYEVQPGTFVMTPVGSVNEGIGAFIAQVQRTNGFEGPATVRISTVASTAGTADYQLISNQVVTFADEQLSQDVLVTITNDSLVEANETFNLALNTPSAGCTLGSPSSIPVTILDPSGTSPTTDTVAPAAPVITSPAANAKVNTTGQLSITGTATDNKGVDEVTVTITTDGVPGAPVEATLDRQNATSTGWSVTFPITTGVKTVLIQVQSEDNADRVSPVTSRTVSLMHPLVVNLRGNGSVNAGFAPSSFRQLGQSHTITATPVAGHLFTGWTLQGATTAHLGIQAVALERPTLTFLHSYDLQLTANFKPSPFIPALTGNYKALILPSTTVPAGGTPSNNSTEGLFNATINSNGAFTGNIVIDGLTRSFSGALDHLGTARFGTSRATTLRMARSGKPSQVLAFHMLEVGGALNPKLIGTLQALDFRNELVAQSDIEADRSHYNGTTQLAPPDLLGAVNANAVYNCVLLPIPPGPLQPPGFEESYYPQGTGLCRMTLTKAGVLTLTDGTLADGTTGFSVSTFLDSQNHAVLFIPLYNKAGFIRTRLIFDTSSANTDVTGQDPRWLRPEITTSHYYRVGWPEVISVNFDGSKYVVTAGQSVVTAQTGGPLGPPDTDGNIFLAFEKGQLTETVNKGFNLSTSDVVTKVPNNDPTYTISITRSTGYFSGTFAHTDTNVVSFKGIILQKSPLCGGFGYFLTKQPSPIDYSGESGKMEFFDDP